MRKQKQHLKAIANVVIVSLTKSMLTKHIVLNVCRLARLYNNLNLKCPYYSKP